MTAKYRQLLMVLLMFSILLNGQNQESNSIILGAERMGAYLAFLHEKSVAIVANQTSVINNTHLVDTLLKRGVAIEKVFAPEHGFRGKKDAGESLKDGIDSRTKLPIVSLYGKNKKPSESMLQGIDIVIFDIQDVGARFYTYISTLTYVMEACAENGIELIVLDRPNPHGHYIDGPILQSKNSSFVGLHPIPIVHGMTVGEYAQMINGEQWLKNGVKVNLKVIKCENYDHKTLYELPIAPSPNLPNQLAISLYPSLCFFEGTNVSVGRGTSIPFQIIGSPYWTDFDTIFIPVSGPGAKYPKHENLKCKGFDLREFSEHYMIGANKIQIEFLLEAYNSTENKEAFFNNFFEKLAGTSLLRKQITDHLSAQEIRSSWQNGLVEYQKTRIKYLLYPDFN